MNPQVIFMLLKNNQVNIKNIISIIGIDNLFKLMPDIIAIVETLQSAQGTTK